MKVSNRLARLGTQTKTWYLTRILILDCQIEKLQKDIAKLKLTKPELGYNKAYLLRKYEYFKTIPNCTGEYHQIFYKSVRNEYLPYEEYVLAARKLGNVVNRKKAKRERYLRFLYNLDQQTYQLAKHYNETN